METIKERAKIFAEREYITDSYEIERLSFAYFRGATEQKQIDIDKACEWIMTTPMYAKQPSQLVEEFCKAMEK